MEPEPLVDIVSAHHERAVVLAGDVYLKVDVDTERLRRERAAMELAPVPAPQILWWHEGPPVVFAMSRIRGTALARLGEPSPHPASAWRAAGATARRIHERELPANLPSARSTAWPVDETAAWLVANTTIDRRLIEGRVHSVKSRLDAHVAAPAFIHGDFQAEHVVIAGSEVAGVIDWADAGRGDPHADIAALTIGHREYLEEVLIGYAGDLDREVIRGHWSLGRLRAVRWMLEHGFDASGDIAALALD